MTSSPGGPSSKLISGFNSLNSFQHFSKAFLLLGLICSKTSSSEKIFFSILQQQITNQSKSSGQTDPCLFVVCERVHLVNRTPRKPRPSAPHHPIPHPPNFPEDKKEFKTGCIKLPMQLCCKCGLGLWILTSQDFLRGQKSLGPLKKSQFCAGTILSP